MELLPLTVGCDPEGFIVNNKTKSFVSAHGLIPGTKADPHIVGGGAVQVDGMAAEFNINPSSTKKEFIDNILLVKKNLKAMLPEGHDLAFIPVAEFPKEIWDKVPEEAKELGCDPDFNAYTKQVNPRPDGARTFRTAAGHIHLGWTKGMDVNDPGHIDACSMMARQLDFYIGLPSLLFDPDPTRRQMYGKAGAYRIKPYGVEYRTPSNVWVNEPELMAWVFDNVEKAFNDLMDGKELYNKLKDYASIVIDSDSAKGVSRLTQLEIINVCKEVLGVELPPEKFFVKARGQYVR